MAFYFLIAAVWFSSGSCTMKDKQPLVKATQSYDDMILKAVKNNDIITTRELIKQGANVETRDTEGKTLLLIATHHNHIEIAEILVAAGANVNAQDAIKDSPFLYAGATGKITLVRLYLDHGADFTVFNRYGGTALIPAAERGHTDVVRLLSSTPGFPVNHINNLGWTALMEAVILGDGGKTHTEIVQILINSGADAGIPDSKGITALQHAQKRGYKEMVRLLEKTVKK